MKKIFLIFALTALMSIGVNAEENKVDVQQQEQSAPAAPESSTDISLFPDRLYNELADSFVAAFDMEVEAGSLADSFITAFGMEIEAAGDTGDGAPGLGKAAKSKAAISRDKMGAAMSNIHSTVINQVAPPFMPYSYQK